MSTSPEVRIRTESMWFPLWVAARTLMALPQSTTGDGQDAHQAQSDVTVFSYDVPYLPSSWRCKTIPVDIFTATLYL